MLCLQDFVEDNSRRLISEGDSSFWFENYLGTCPLATRKTRNPRLDLTIRDCLVDGSWNLEAVEDVLSPSFSNGSDLLAWCPSSNGIFSISSVIRRLYSQGASMISHRLIWDKSTGNHFIDILHMEVVEFSASLSRHFIVVWLQFSV